MTKIKHLEMGQSIANNKHIRVKSSLFGLSESIVYEPTGSTAKLIRQEYDQSAGSRLAKLLEMPVDKMCHELAEKGTPKPMNIGNYRLEGALSADRQFAAMQLFQYSDFMYHPASECYFYEGATAEQASKLFGQN